MPMPIISVPQFPNVPNTPGVPPVARGLGVNFGQEEEPVQIDQANMPQPVNQVWGIFDAAGALALEPDTIAQVGGREETQVATYPQEKGAFASYNKVAMPTAVRVRMAKGGTEKERSEFLTKAREICKALGLCSVTMPDGTFSNMNPVAVDLVRDAGEGANMLILDMLLQEVRITGLTTFSKTKAPDGARQVNGGTVQPVEPTTAQAQAAQGVR